MARTPISDDRRLRFDIGAGDRLEPIIITPDSDRHTVPGPSGNFSGGGIPGLGPGDYGSPNDYGPMGEPPSSEPGSPGYTSGPRFFVKLPGNQSFYREAFNSLVEAGISDSIFDEHGNLLLDSTQALLSAQTVGNIAMRSQWALAAAEKAGLKVKSAVGMELSDRIIHAFPAAAKILKQHVPKMVPHVTSGHSDHPSKFKAASTSNHADRNAIDVGFNAWRTGISDDADRRAIMDRAAFDLYQELKKVRLYSNRFRVLSEHWTDSSNDHIHIDVPTKSQKPGAYRLDRTQSPPVMVPIRNPAPGVGAMLEDSELYDVSSKDFESSLEGNATNAVKVLDRMIEIVDELKTNNNQKYKLKTAAVARLSKVLRSPLLSQRDHFDLTEKDRR